MSQIAELKWRGIAFVAVLTLAAFARADTIYTDRSDWEAVVGGLYSEENFSDSTLNTGVSVVSDAGSVSAGAWRDRLTTLAQTTFSFSDPITHLVGIGI